MFEWDERKKKANLTKHGIDFDAVWDFEWHTATAQIDARTNYGETRHLAYGMIDGRLHALVYTKRSDVIRVISLRKTNAREQRVYEEKTKSTYH